MKQEACAWTSKCCAHHICVFFSCQQWYLIQSVTQSTPRRVNVHKKKL